MSTSAIEPAEGRDNSAAAEMGGLLLLWAVPVTGFCLAMFGIR